MLCSNRKQTTGSMARSTYAANRCCWFGRGTVNPDTGVMRLHCDDSVAWGNYGAFDPVLIARLQVPPTPVPRAI